MGGKSAHILSQEFPFDHTKFFLYESPEIELTTGDDRVTSYSHYGDPVSALDFAAHRDWSPELNPHTYRD